MLFSSEWLARYVDLPDDNEELTDLAGLEALAQVGKDLNIYDNEKLAGLEGLAGLVDIGARLFIVENSNLPTSQAEALAERAAPGEVSIVNNRN